MRGGAEIMKKLLSILFCLTILPVFALTITPDTQLKWNSLVIKRALNQNGLDDEYGRHTEVISTYNNIMNFLLNLETFSAEEAVQVCVEQCNKSDFLKNGRGQSGRTCPDICEDFGNSLVEINNDKITNESWSQYYCNEKIYSKDKLFYAFETNTVYGEFDSPCKYAIFESNSNKIIAECANMACAEGQCAYDFKAIDAKYKYFDFGMFEQYSCELIYTDVEAEYRKYHDHMQSCKEKVLDILPDAKNLLSDPWLNRFHKKNLENSVDQMEYILREAENLNFENYYQHGDWQSSYDPCHADNWSRDIRSGKESVEHIKSFFITSGINRTFKDKQTGSLDEAKRLIAKEMWVDSDELTCTGKCNPIPGTQDKVTCVYGSFSATFEFDDICD